MNKKNIAIATLAAVGLLVLGSAATSFFSPVSFNDRWQHTMIDLAKPQSSIPRERLHARALEILRERTVAQED